LPCWLALGLATACGSDDAEGGDDPSVEDGADDAVNEADDDVADDAADDADDANDADEGGDTNQQGEVIYEESFDGEDGSPWPDPWQVAGTRIIDAELDGGRGRMSGQTNLTARILLTGYDLVDVDVTAVVEFENFSSQGYGFFARQNGGALLETDPPGQGYGVYIEGGNLRSVGLWKEIDGVEMPILEVADALADGIEAGTPYAVRFQCLQREGSTLLRAKVWRDGDDEPSEWIAETEDSTPELQNTSGSFANDVYNYAGTGSIWVHEVTVREM